MKARKPRSDSTTAALFAIENARKPPPAPPAHVKLRDSDKPYWDSIIAARARDEWTPVSLVLAAQLARCQSDIEIEQATLTVEGNVIDNKVNPRATVIDVLAKRQMALMRSLRMAGTALGKTPTIENNRRMERSYSEAGFDDLIAR